jgi:hypothetical protein
MQSRKRSLHGGEAADNRVFSSYFRRTAAATAKGGR